MLSASNISYIARADKLQIVLFDSYINVNLVCVLRVKFAYLQNIVIYQNIGSVIHVTNDAVSGRCLALWHVYR